LTAPATWSGGTIPSPRPRTRPRPAECGSPPTGCARSPRRGGDAHHGSDFANVAERRSGRPRRTRSLSRDLGGTARGRGEVRDAFQFSPGFRFGRVLDVEHERLEKELEAEDERHGGHDDGPGLRGPVVDRPPDPVVGAEDRAEGEEEEAEDEEQRDRRDVVEDVAPEDPAEETREQPRRELQGDTPRLQGAGLAGITGGEGDIGD